MASEAADSEAVEDTVAAEDSIEEGDLAEEADTMAAEGSTEEVDSVAGHQEAEEATEVTEAATVVAGNETLPCFPTHYFPLLATYCFPFSAIFKDYLT